MKSISNVQLDKIESAQEKAAINSALQCKLQYIDDRAIVNCGLIGAKVVNVKEFRQCCECSKPIPQGRIALTSSTRNEAGYKRRIYRCLPCGQRVLNEAAELTDEYVHQDALRDAFSDYF